MKPSILRKLAVAFVVVVGLTAVMPASAARGTRPTPPLAPAVNTPISPI